VRGGAANFLCDNVLLQVGLEPSIFQIAVLHLTDQANLGAFLAFSEFVVEIMRTLSWPKTTVIFTTYVLYN